MGVRGHFIFNYHLYHYLIGYCIKSIFSDSVIVICKVIIDNMTQVFHLKTYGNVLLLGVTAGVFLR